jgi:hypothetical protein
VLFTFPNYHAGIATAADTSLYPELWDSLGYGWDPMAQDAQGRLYDFVRGTHRDLTSLAAADWKVQQDGQLALHYDGTADGDQTATTLDLTTVTQMTVVWDMYWNAFANDDDLAWETSANFNSNAGAILCDPNESGASSFTVGVRNSAATANSYGSFPRPSAAAWHNYQLTLDIGLWGSGITSVATVHVDGVLQTITPNASTTTTNAPTGFGNYTWNFMCRAVSSLFGAGRMGRFLIYPGAILRTEHAQAFTEGASPFVRRRKLWSMHVPAAGGGSAFNPYYYQLLTA